MSIRATVKYSKLQNISRKFTKQEITDILDEGMSHAADLARARVHVVSGRLESSITAVVYAYKAMLVANTPYAAAERARGGTHDFATEPFQAGVELIRKRFNDLIRG